MENSHFSLTWEKFHSSMCAGFSLLQQDGELVDLTLAADGHLVKVHQVVIGVASPYLKSLILSANCKNPVIFLNNVSYSILRSILEYVYTGEVAIEEKNVNAFFETAKNLQIRGLEDETSSILKPHQESESTVFETQDVAPVKRFKLETLNNKQVKVTEDVPLPSTAKNVILKHKTSVSKPQPQRMHITKPQQSDSMAFDEMTEEDDGDHWSPIAASDDENLTSDDRIDTNKGTRNNKTNNKDEDESASNVELKYTVSNQGSIQLILNRYMYNLKNYQRRHGSLRRWYCVDHNRQHCPARVVTQDNIVIQRSKLHNHPFHDKRILGKVQKKAVYTAIQAAQAADKDD